MGSYRITWIPSSDSLTSHLNPSNGVPSLIQSPKMMMRQVFPSGKTLPGSTSRPIAAITKASLVFPRKSLFFHQMGISCPATRFGHEAALIHGGTDLWIADTTQH